MTAIRLNQASEINRLHDMAVASANRAVDYAKQAGALLLEVKRELAHGEFGAWLGTNVKVSERQAQRYMRAALGKVAVTALIKSDTLSDLPAWLPSCGHVASVQFRDGDALYVQEHMDAPGYYKVLFLYGGNAEWTQRGVRGDYVQQTIVSMLPGGYSSGGLDRFQWQTVAADSDFIDCLIAIASGAPE